MNDERCRIPDVALADFVPDLSTLERTERDPSMSKLHQLHADQGQSPWAVRRPWHTLSCEACDLHPLRQTASDRGDQYGRSAADPERH